MLKIYEQGDHPHVALTQIETFPDIITELVTINYLTVVEVVTVVLTDELEIRMEELMLLDTVLDVLKDICHHHVVLALII